MIDAARARQVLESAELLHGPEEVLATVDRMAGEITETLGEKTPLVLAVMNGALPFAGHLLTRLRFPLDFDYLHATRYGDATTGGELSWRVAPGQVVRGRHVLLLDDILDEGITLAAIRERLLEQGALSVTSAVFSEKHLGREKPLKADFVGLSLPNRYVFGFGMDVEGAWRNLPAIYAVKEGK